MRITDIELLGDDVPGTLSVRATEDPVPPADGDTLEIFVWADAGETNAGMLLEMIGNRTVKLVGRYSFRYDPPRSASTGAGKTPRGDCHLYDGDVEIAAWDAAGKARHGFPSGTRLPKKAYDAIVAKYPGIHGLKGRMLEHLTASVRTARPVLTEAKGGPEDFLTPQFLEAARDALAEQGFVSDEHDFAPYRDTLPKRCDATMAALAEIGTVVTLVPGFVEHPQAGYAYFVYDADRFRSHDEAAQAVGGWLDGKYGSGSNGA